jgi:hypothetical protein
MDRRNRYCATCEQLAVHDEEGRCTWCDNPISKNYRQRRDFGRPQKMTVDQVEQAWDWYQEEGISLRACADRLWPDTGYASVKSCANGLHQAWHRRGHQLRDKVELMRERNLVHGLARRGRIDPAHRHQVRVKSGEVRGVQCLGVTVRGVACSRPAVAGGEWCRVHDPETGPAFLEMLNQARRKALEEADHSGGRAGGVGARGQRGGAHGSEAGETSDSPGVPAPLPSGAGGCLVRVAV